ncbi:MAG TPA: hypothetical protein VK539_34615 [Myxococcaceae bacterium]|nr:hypothetical protein [Myxococcaceae bacterium]
MSTRMRPQKLVVMVLCLLLGSCSATRPMVGPTGARDLARYVLIVQEMPDGRMTHFWRPTGEFDLEQYQELLSRRLERGRTVPVVWQRDCDEEMRQCINKCMRGNLGDDWEHLVQPPSRKLGGKHAECRKRCWPDYEECNKQNAEDSAKAVELPSIEKAVDWVKRHREELAVGAVVVIAGVTFVVVTGGTGGLVLAPMVLFVSADAFYERDGVAMKP